MAGAASPTAASTHTLTHALIHPPPTVGRVALFRVLNLSTEAGIHITGAGVRGTPAGPSTAWGGVRWRCVAWGGNGTGDAWRGCTAWGGMAGGYMAQRGGAARAASARPRPT